MAFRVKLKSSGMQAILSGPAMERDMLRRAELVAAAARALAPVVTGTYRASITARVEHTDRAVGRVYADVPYAVSVEATQRPLGRSIDAAG